MTSEAPPAFFKLPLRDCPVSGCTNQHDTSKLMCSRHWYSVPQELRDEVWRTFRECGVWSDEYREARDAAIAAAES